MKKKVPVFRTDEEAERFVAEADLTEYDLSQFKPVRFEFEKKAARVNMRLPETLLNAVKARAQARGIPYQRFIREALERAVTGEP
jgi:predicted DNA binding CopG/RHH family protein